MPRISEMPAPAALTGLEMIPALQGIDDAGLPLLAMASVPRGAVLQLRVPMTADLSATSDADPGAAKVRWNNADPDAATVLYIDDADGDSGDVAAALGALTLGGYLYLQAHDPERRGTWQKWQVSTVTDASGYTKIGATLLDSDGTFEADEAIELTVQQPNPPSPTSKTVQLMLSDMATALATGTGVAMWVAPEDGEFTDFWLAVGTVSSSGAVTVDLNDAGGSVLTTPPSIDASEHTSLTGTAAVFDGTVSFSKGDIFTFDRDAAGTGAKALMAILEYEPT